MPQVWGKVKIPAGKKIAVNLGCDFDAQSLWICLNRTSPAYMSRGEFGAEVGMPRLMRLFDNRRGRSRAMDFHEQITVIDGLIAAKWGPDVFKAMREGGLTAVNATCIAWEGTRKTLDILAQWYQWFDRYSDLIMPVRHTRDIAAAKASRCTGIILGFQNGSPIEDRLDYLALFKQLGVGIIQLTYNTQNYIGSGCYESHDSGLSDFGREVVAEMNRVGIAVDLSHVGSKTTDDTIEFSKDPVVFSHVLPAELKAHPRNKETRQLRAVADRNGLVSVTMFPPFLPKGSESTVDDYAEIIEWMVNVCGEDQVGFGTDSIQGFESDPAWFQWAVRDKGLWRPLVQWGKIENPKGFERIEQTPNLTAALERRRWPSARIEKIMGLNWVLYLKRVWHE